MDESKRYGGKLLKQVQHTDKGRYGFLITEDSNEVWVNGFIKDLPGNFELDDIVEIEYVKKPAGLDDQGIEKFFRNVKSVKLIKSKQIAEVVEEAQNTLQQNHMCRCPECNKVIQLTPVA